MRNLKYPTVIPLSTMAFIVGAMFLGLYLHMPDEKEIVERMMNDGLYTQAFRKVSKYKAKELDKDPVFYNFVKIKCSRILNSSPIENKDDYIPYTVEEIWDIAKQYAVPELLFEELLEAIKAQSGGPRTIYSLFKDHEDKLSRRQLEVLFEYIYKYSIEQGDLELAAQLYTEYLITNFGNLEMVKKAVELFRMAGQPKQGLDWMKEYVDLGRFIGKDKREITIIYAKLTLESTQPQVACKIIQEYSQKISNLYKDPEVFEIFVSSAIGSSQASILIPFLKEKIGTPEENEKDFKLYIELLYANKQQKEAGALLEERYKADRLSDEFIKLYAQILEWDGQAANAYEVYKQLVIKNRDFDALNRMIALNPGLFKHEDLIETMLEHFSPETIGEHALTLARLLVMTGRYEKSVPYFEVELQKHPENTQLLMEIAEAYRTSYSFELSLEYYRKVNKIDPNDVEAIVRSAELAAYLENFDLALALYRDAYKVSAKPTLIPLILNLASTTDREQIYYDFLEKKIDQALPVTVDDYLDLNYVLSKQKRTEDQVKYLKQGLIQFPDDLSLRKELIYTHYDNKMFPEALSEVVKTKLAGKDAEITNLYLSLNMETGKPKEAYKTLLEINPNFILSNTNLMQTAAWIFETNKDYAKSDSLYTKLYQSNPENPNYIASFVNLLVRQGKASEAEKLMSGLDISNNPDLMRAMSYVYSKRNQYKQAEDVQISLLKKTGKESFYDWGNLGDIRLSQGNSKEAKRAYLISLDRMVNQLKEGEIKTLSRSESNAQ